MRDPQLRRSAELRREPDGRVRPVELHQRKRQVWKRVFESGYAECGWHDGADDGSGGDGEFGGVDDGYLVKGGSERSGLLLDRRG